jgi:hypothetical protein
MNFRVVLLPLLLAIPLISIAAEEKTKDRKPSGRELRVQAKSMSPGETESEYQYWMGLEKKQNLKASAEAFIKSGELAVDLNALIRALQLSGTCNISNRQVAILIAGTPSHELSPENLSRECIRFLTFSRMLSSDRN